MNKSEPLSVEQVEAHREVFSRLIHENVTEHGIVAAEQRVAICDLALQALRLRDLLTWNGSLWTDHDAGKGE